MTGKTCDAWGARAPMNEARSHFGSALFEGKIYCFGGGGSDFKSLNSVEFYDPETDRWHNAAHMPTVRSGLAAVTLGDEIYVIGGGFKGKDGNFNFFKTVEIYSPKTDSWRAGPDMLTPHDYPAAVVCNGKIHVVGGHHPEASGGPLTDPGSGFCEIFDPAEGDWMEGPGLNHPRFALAAVTLRNGIYAMGGGAFQKKDGQFLNLRVNEMLENGGTRWVVNEKMRLPWNAAGAGACLLNGRIYLFGGNTGEKIENSAACFDFDKNRWIEMPPMDQPRIVMGVHPIGESIYIIGGRMADKKTPTASVIQYHPQLTLT